MKLKEPLLSRYIKDPLGMDEEVRDNLNIPADKYYSVTTYSVNQASYGDVTILRGERIVKARKVSKSDQPTKT